MIDASIPMSVTVPAITTGNELGLQERKLQDYDNTNQLNQQKIAEGKIDLENKQRTATAQKTLSDLLQKHTTVGQDGKVNTDFDAAGAGLTAAGFGQEAMKLNSDRAKSLREAVDLHSEQLKANGAIAGRLGELAGAVGSVNQTETDPAKLLMDKNAWASRAQTALNQATKEGLVAPGVALQASQQIQNGWTPEAEAQFKLFRDSAIGAHTQFEEAHQTLQENRAKLTGEATAADNAAKAERLQREDAATQLLANSGDQASYARAYNTLNPKMQQYFPHPSEYDARSTPQKIQTLGTTMEMRAKLEEQGYQKQQDRLNRASIADQADATRRDIAADRKATVRQGDRTAANEARTQIDKLEDQEEKLYGLRTKLFSALGSTAKNAFINDKGELVETKDSISAAQRQEMIDKLKGTTDTLSRIYKRKNDHAAQIPGSNPTTSAEQAEANLRGNDAKWFAAQAERDKAANGETPPPAEAQKPAANNAPANQPAKRNPVAGGTTWKDQKGRSWSMNQEIAVNVKDSAGNVTTKKGWIVGKGADGRPQVDYNPPKNVPK